MNILHILNGDATLKGFEETGLDGDVMVWREVFSEGPLEEKIVSGSFWKQRLAWVCETFKESPESYQEKVLDQLTRLSEPYDEINLWFEFDLHCQVNMLGVMTYLKQKSDLSLPAIFLICPSEFPGKPDFAGMGELNGEELEYLYDNIRIQLSQMDFIVAENAWQSFGNKDTESLRAELSSPGYYGNLHHLKPALEAQLKRLEKNKNGLNCIEQKLLDIYNSGKRASQEIYTAFRETEKIYGMGDKEIDIYLNSLKSKGLLPDAF